MLSLRAEFGWFLLAGITAASCNNAAKNIKGGFHRHRGAGLPNRRLLSRAQSLEKLQVEDGFTVQPVAAEPLVVVPVAMTFDERGRMYVAEMTGYMPDTVGTGEEAMNGKIVILEDTEWGRRGGYPHRVPGLADTAPRALHSGQRPAGWPSRRGLWNYVEINGGKPGRKPW